MAFLDFGNPNRDIDAVFLHANGFNALTYRQILAPLGERFRIIAVDQRGHGRSSLDTTLADRRDWTDLQDDLLAFLSVMNLTDVVLSGHSMGATACLLAASRLPARRRPLVLFDPVILPPDQGVTPTDSPLLLGARKRRALFPSRAEATRSYAGRGAFKTWPDLMLADYVEAGFKDLPSGEVTLSCEPAWEASGFAAHGHDPWAALRATTSPLNILRAEFGSTFHLGDAPFIDPQRIHITTVVGASHFLPMERPDLVEDALIRAMEA